MKVATVRGCDDSVAFVEIGDAGATAVAYDPESGAWTRLRDLPGEVPNAALEPPFAAAAVIAPGPQLDGPPEWQERHREFHVKPASVLPSRRSAAPRRPATLGCRLQAGLVFRSTPRFTDRETILERLIGCHVVAELVDLDAFVIDWEGPRWHLRFGESMSFDDACPMSAVLATPDEFGRDGIVVNHAHGELLLSWSAMADFAAHVNGYLELGPRLLVLAGWTLGPVVAPAERRSGPTLRQGDPVGTSGLGRQQGRWSRRLGTGGLRVTRLLTYELDGRSRLGCLVDGRVVDVERRLSSTTLAPSRSLAEFIARGPDYWAAAESALATLMPSDPPLAALHLRAPLQPAVIICGGANFHDHLAETGRARPARVEFFFKSPTAVIGPHDEVHMVPRLSAKYDYEVELGIVIGRTAVDVAADEALSYVFGYVVVNDVSIRDHQIVLDGDGTSHGRFGPGKSFDDACPIGPWVVTTAEVPDPAMLVLETRVDGELRQRSDMRHAIWSVPELVAYYSRQLTLQPGWLIAAGTPAGPALGSDLELRARPRALGEGVARGGYVEPGQVVECRIEGIGALSNRYVVGA